MSPHPLIFSPTAGFEAPFDMLAACHERVQRMLALVRRLQLHVQTHGCDAQAQRAAVDVMRYFDLAAPQHHLDEELHVFPALLAAGQQVQLVRRLLAEHRAMAALWPAVRAVLQAVAQGRSGGLLPQEDAALAQYAGLYGAHLQAEDELAYPAALQLLDGLAQQAMGQEMAQRRGAPPR